MNNERLIILLTDILDGQPQNPNAQWVYFDCPFCHHHKKKFAFNTNTHAWKCWICQSRGISLFSLIRRLNKWHLKDRVQTTVDALKKSPIKLVKPTGGIKLPSEFVSLSDSRQFILKNRVTKYLSRRNIGKYQIEKYNIGFCPSGQFQNRIIVPSYNEQHHLNYFVGRSILPDQTRKYLNPKCDRQNVIIFQELINWNFPVIITQGIFDAMTINFNSIPLMGKVLTDNLIQKLLYYDADVYVSLDNDARETQQRMLKKLLSYGLDSLHYVNLPEKDPSQMGRLSYWQYLLTNSKKYSGSTELELMKNKVGRLFK